MGWLDGFFTGYSLVQGAGVAVPKQGTLNFIGVTIVDDPTNGRTNVTISGGGGSTPTGTGIPHIVAGVQGAVASLIVNADVDASAAIDGSKIVSTFPGQEVLCAGIDADAPGPLTIGDANATSILLDGGAGDGVHVLNLAGSAGIVHSDAGTGHLTSSLIVNADVDAAAAIAGSKIVPEFFSGATPVASLAVSSADFVAFGAAPAASAFVRMSQSASGTTKLLSVKNTAGTDICFAGFWHVGVGDDRFQLGPGSDAPGTAGIVFVSVVNQIYVQTTNGLVLANTSGVGHATISGTVGGASTYTVSAAQTSMKFEHNDVATASATGAPMTLAAQNATGTTATGGTLHLAAGTGTTTYGNVSIEGALVTGAPVTKAMADAPQTLTAAQSASNMVITTGANTAVRALTVARPPTSGTMLFVRNNCSVNGITVQFSSGTATATILPSTSALVYGDGTNAQILMVGT